MKQIKLLITMGLTAILLAGCSAAPQSSALDTPEKAVTAYVAALAAGDFNAALALCPADAMMKNFNSTEYGKTMVIGNNESVDGIKARYTQQTALLSASLLKGETAELEENMVIDEAWTAQLLKENRPKLKDLQALRIDKPYKAGYNLEVDSDVYKQATKSNRLIWGTEGYTERIALLQHSGKTYMAGFTLAQYDGSWGILYATSTFANLTSGNAKETVQDEYLKHAKPETESK